MHHTNEAVTGYRYERERLRPAPSVEVNDPNTDETNASVVDELTEHQLLLLCPQALAFALKHKQWSQPYCFYPITNFSLTLPIVQISLDHVQESVPSNESISNLVIGEAELKTIQALSNRQNSKVKHWSADFIEGKGSGQIILLHGM